MPSAATIALYSDVHCPYAYVTAYRLRQLREEYRGRVTISYKSLALEYVNRRPTPKPILDNETPFLMLSEPEIPYQPWHAPLSEWPVTMWQRSWTGRSAWRSLRRASVFRCAMC